MVNEQLLEGNWQRVKGKIRSKWGQISEEELQTFSGNVEQLVGEIQRKTGESQEAIRGYLEQWAQEAASLANRITGQTGHYVSQAAASMQGASRQVADSMAYGYGETERLIQRRPAESMATAFVLGLATGVIIGMIVRPR